MTLTKGERCGGLYRTMLHNMGPPAFSPHYFCALILNSLMSSFVLIWLHSRWTALKNQWRTVSLLVSISSEVFLLAVVKASYSFFTYRYVLPVLKLFLFSYNSTDDCIPCVFSLELYNCSNRCNCGLFDMRSQYLRANKRIQYCSPLKLVTLLPKSNSCLV